MDPKRLRPGMMIRTTRSDKYTFKIDKISKKDKNFSGWQLEDGVITSYDTFGFCALEQDDLYCLEGRFESHVKKLT